MTAQQTFLVLAVSLDDGDLYISDRRTSLGTDTVIGAVMDFGAVSAGGVSFNVEKQAIPAPFEQSRWINRSAAIYECTDAMGRVTEGRLLFSGMVDGEPALSAGLYSVKLAANYKPAVELPGYGQITQTDYPLAPDASIGKFKPRIIGTVDECPLIPVQLQAWTVLRTTANPGDNALEVGDTTDFAASGSVTIDGKTYAYTSKSDTVLLGMAVTARHKAGTLVAQAGSNIWLAAGHAVSSISSIKASDTLLDGAVVDLAAATVTFNDMPKVEQSASRYTLGAQFDTLAAGNTATNGGNAINYVSGPVTQQATTKPTGVTASANIAFARPTSGRIISGVYQVSFSVTYAGQQGWARVMVGNQIVWAYQSGVGVLYNTNPATVIFDSDTDVLPVSVEVEPGKTNHISVNITLASRLIYTGSLDDSDYATITPGQSLKVTQTDSLPDRGRIAKSQLHVRWFASDAVLGNCAVSFAGTSLGKLAITPSNPGQKLDKTIAVDTVQAGSATLPAQTISTSITGGTASLNHQSVAQSASVSPKLGLYNPGVPDAMKFIGAGLCPEFGSLQGSITVEVMIDTLDADRFTAYVDVPAMDDPRVLPIEITFYNQDGTATGEKIGFFKTALNFTTDYTNNYAGTTITQVAASNIWRMTGNLTKKPYSYKVAISAWRFPTVKVGGVPTSYAYSVWSNIGEIKFSWNGKPTEAALSLTNTPAGGGTSHSLTTDKVMNVAGMNVAISQQAGRVTLEVPAPPRVVDTLFDLPSYTSWADFTNKTAEITLSGTGASVMVLLVELLIEYDEISYRAAINDMTATVVGSSGNPADVAKTMLELSGETVNADFYRTAFNYFSGAGYAFARRIASQTEALRVLTGALEQSHMMVADADGEKRLVRLLDESGELHAVTESDCIDPIRYQWLTRTENDITIAYREDYAGGSGFTRIIKRSAANNADCAFSAEKLARVYPVAIDAGSIRDDATAAFYADGYAKLYATPRRRIDLALPFTFNAINAGDLLDHDTALWRVMSVNDDGGWLNITADEVPV